MLGFTAQVAVGACAPEKPCARAHKSLRSKRTLQRGDRSADLNMRALTVHECVQQLSKRFLSVDAAKLQYVRLDSLVRAQGLRIDDLVQGARDYSRYLAMIAVISQVVTTRPLHWLAAFRGNRVRTVRVHSLRARHRSSPRRCKSRPLAKPPAPVQRSAACSRRFQRSKLFLLRTSY